MKKYLYIYVASILLLITGCRTDGGDIGYLYGQWATREYTIDSEIQDIELTKYYWMFQGKIVFIKEVLPGNRYDNTLGTWSREGDILILDFTQTMINPNTGESVDLNPPEPLGIPGREITEMHIDKLTDKDMILQYTDAEGKIHRYVLEKLK